jgi:hypothetical protein
MRVGEFYKECGRRAFSGKFWLVEKWSGGLGVLTALVAAFVPASLFHITEVEMARWATFLPVCFFALVFFVALVLGFILAPSKMYQEQVELRIAAEKELKPTISVFLQTSDLETVSRGSTVETNLGKRSTVVSEWITGVATIYCKNNGGKSAKNCRVHIHSIKRDEEKLELLVPVELGWAADLGSTSPLKQDISALETKRISVARIASNGSIWVAREISKLPLEHQRLLGEPGKYLIEMIISGDNIAPTRVLAEIITDVADPITYGVQKPKGRIAILKSGF